MSLPPLPTVAMVRERLQEIFPPGTPHRAYCIRDLAASTVFTALYVGAVEDGETFLGPKHVYRMTDEQSLLTADSDRLAYASNVIRVGHAVAGRRWYQDNTREPIRDETLREGLIAVGAVGERTNVATTSSKPRYFLKAGFAELFDPALAGGILDQHIQGWRADVLSPGALAKIAMVRRGAGAVGDRVLVTFPNGETQLMQPGPSSEITKAVIEQFAPRFLKDPAVLFVSESGAKVVARHDDLARAIGLSIEADRNLPDVILVDLAPKTPLLVFVEVVATDGPINERRKKALEDLAGRAGLSLKNLAFVTALLDRSAGPFKKVVDSLAWGAYAWFASEPDNIIEFASAPRSLVED